MYVLCSEKKNKDNAPDDRIKAPQTLESYLAKLKVRALVQCVCVRIIYIYIYNIICKYVCMYERMYIH
jgi:hypothetical protein